MNTKHRKLEIIDNKLVTIGKRQFQLQIAYRLLSIANKFIQYPAPVIAIPSLSREWQ